ncbi:MAG: UxaA family hydrolase [Puia sp.]
MDGIRFLTHEGGCGGIRQDSAVLGKLLAAYANHPNVGGITILSLGCQHLQSPNCWKTSKNQARVSINPLCIRTTAITE